jgi:archaellum component FlaC
MEQEPMTLEKLAEQIDQRFEQVDQRFEQIDQRFEQIDQRLNGTDGDIRGLGVMMEAMDDKFTAMSEAQDIIRDVLETRVAHIEEVLEIKAAV